MALSIFSADDGQINSASSPGAFHSDLYNGGPKGVSINVDDAAEASSGTFTNTWFGVAVRQLALSHFPSGNSDPVPAIETMKAIWRIQDFFGYESSGIKEILNGETAAGH